MRRQSVLWISFGILFILLLVSVWGSLPWRAPTPPLSAPYLHYRLADHPKYHETPLHHVYAFHLLKPGTCRGFVNAIEAYAEQNGGWTTKRHSSYPTTDIPIKSTPLWPSVESVVRDRVFPILAQAYGFEKRYLSIRDLFFVKYDADTPGAQKHLKFHRDGTLLSFNILCNPRSEFDGGGTMFEALGNTVVDPQACGDLVIHSGKLRHSGAAITRGRRYLIVGFVNVSDPDVNNNLLQRNRNSIKSIELDYMLTTSTVSMKKIKKIK